jgi:hypothetical protein
MAAITFSAGAWRFLETECGFRQENKTLAFNVYFLSNARLENKCSRGKSFQTVRSMETPLDSDLKDIASTPPTFENTAIEYTQYFDIFALNPKLGDVFRFFVAQPYISFSYSAIEQRQCYGSIHYSPQSDIATITFHSGCLFVNQYESDVPTPSLHDRESF